MWYPAVDYRYKTYFVERLGYGFVFGKLVSFMFLPLSYVKRELSGLWHDICSGLSSAITVYAGVGCNDEADKLCIYTTDRAVSLSLDSYRLFGRGFGIVAKYKSPFVIRAGTAITGIRAHPMGLYDFSECPIRVRAVTTVVPVRFVVSRDTDTLVFASVLSYNRALRYYGAF